VWSEEFGSAESFEACFRVQVRKVLSTPFTLAVKLGQIPANPLIAIAPLRSAAGEKSVFTPDQVIRLVKAAQGDWKGVILAGYYTGARLQDVTNLKWSNVDLVKRLIIFTAGKTNTKVVVTIHPDLEDHLLSLKMSDDPQAPVFPEVAGKAGPGRNGLSMTFKRIMLAAGIESAKARERAGKAGRSGVVVRKHLRAKPRVAFNRSCFVLPNGICCESEKVCSFADWEKAFWLAAFEFGLVKHGDPASDRGINILLQRYGLKPDDTFLQDLAKLKHQPNRWKNREFLNRFAMAWDIFIVPLRFFTDESARDFALEYLGLNGEDISNYRKLIHRGGAKRQDGLRLVSEKPPIVTEWKLTITLSKSGAKRHVFPVEPAVEFLRKFSGRQAIEDKVVWTCCKNNDGVLGPRSAWIRANGLFTPVVEFDWHAFDNPSPEKDLGITKVKLRLSSKTAGSSCRELRPSKGCRRSLKKEKPSATMPSNVEGNSMRTCQRKTDLWSGKSDLPVSENPIRAPDNRKFFRTVFRFGKYRKRSGRSGILLEEGLIFEEEKKNYMHFDLKNEKRI
jgi:Phage integrase family